MVHNVSARSSLHLHLGPPEAIVRLPEISLSSQRLGPNLREVPPATSGRFLLQRFSEVFRDFQRFSEVFRDLQRLSEVLKPGAKNLREVFVVALHLAECLDRHCWRFLRRVVMS